MNDIARIIVKVGIQTPDIRECRIEKGHYIHILNSAWRLPINDPSIIHTTRETHES